MSDEWNLSNFWEKLAERKITGMGCHNPKVVKALYRKLILACETREVAVGEELDCDVQRQAQQLNEATINSVYTCVCVYMYMYLTAENME